MKTAQESKAQQKISTKPVYRFHEAIGQWKVILIRGEGWPEQATGFDSYESARNWLESVGAIWADYDN
jgi:hypothetical protein